MPLCHGTPDGDVPYTPEEEAAYYAAEAERKVRDLRDLLLRRCDWVVIKSKETGTNIPAAWKNYRQSLRDISTQDGFPNDVTWPTDPNGEGQPPPSRFG